jgi:hypothetical protein
LGDLKLKADSKIDVYLSTFKKLQLELIDQGERIPDDQLIGYILEGLPNHYEAFIQTIENDKEEVYEETSRNSSKSLREGGRRRDWTSI